MNSSENIKKKFKMFELLFAPLYRDLPSSLQIYSFFFFGSEGGATGGSLKILTYAPTEGMKCSEANPFVPKGARISPLNGPVRSGQYTTRKKREFFAKGQPEILL